MSWWSVGLTLLAVISFGIAMFASSRSIREDQEQRREAKIESAMGSKLIEALENSGNWRSYRGGRPYDWDWEGDFDPPVAA